MALIAAQSIPVTGDDITFAAAAADDTALVQRNAVLVVKNDDAASKTVTLAAQLPADNLTDIADTVVTVAAGAVALIPIELPLYRNVDGEVEISYSATTSVTRAVVLV